MNFYGYLHQKFVWLFVQWTFETIPIVWFLFTFYQIKEVNVTQNKKWKLFWKTFKARNDSTIVVFDLISNNLKIERISL